MIISEKYGLYFQYNNVDGEDGDFITNLVAFPGAVSHHDQTWTGKMCPSPGFQIDRIPSYR